MSSAADRQTVGAAIRHRVLTDVPASLTHRTLRSDDDGVVFCLEDDRLAQSVAVAGGAAAVGLLFASWGLTGLVWPGGLGALGLAALVVACVPRIERPTAELSVSPQRLVLDGVPVPWPANVELDGAWLVLGDRRVALHGESDEARTALVEFLRQVSGESELDRG